MNRGRLFHLLGKVTLGLKYINIIREASRDILVILDAAVMVAVKQEAPICWMNHNRMHK